MSDSLWTSSAPESALTDHQLHKARNPMAAFASYLSVEMVDTLDFSIDGIGDSEQMPDISQQNLPLNTFSTPSLMETSNIIPDLMLQSQNQESQNNASPTLEEQLSQANSKTSTPFLHSSFSLLQSADAARTNGFPLTPDSEMFLSGRDISSGQSQNHQQANHSSEINDMTKLFSPPIVSRTPDPGPDASQDADDLEARFEKIIRVVEEAGFESIDDMSAMYYTATFKEDTLSYCAQLRSRRRSLPIFLASLHNSTSNWSNREAEGYRQHITRVSEHLHVNEFVCAREEILLEDGPRQCQGRNQTLGNKNASAISSTSTSRLTRNGLSMEKLWEVISEMDSTREFKQKKSMLREKVCY